MKSLTREMQIFVNSPRCEKLYKHHVLIPYVAIKIVFIEMIDIGGTERQRQAAYCQQNSVGKHFLQSAQVSSADFLLV